jgi:hypothetical protein
MMLTDVNSSFNALLTRVTRRFANGFSVNAEYRFSKSLDTCSNNANCAQTYPFDQGEERGPSDFDVPHAFHGYATWDLPFFRGRDDLLETIAGGWQVSGIVTASSGFPWTPVFGGALCNVAVAAGGICPQRPVAYSGGVSNSTPSNDTLQQQFGQFTGGPLNYFTPPPSGTFAEPPRPGVGRNSFRGPRYLNVDLTLVKQFRLPAMPALGDNASVEFRMNAFNVFNTLNLTPFTFNSASTQIENPDFGRATSALAGRVIEFQGRFAF